MSVHSSNTCKALILLLSDSDNHINMSENGTNGAAADKEVKAEAPEAAGDAKASEQVKGEAAKEEAEVKSAPADPVRIVRQVEHYFGDFNFPKDKFLQEATKEDEGWVPMTTMLKFTRLASISRDAGEIMAALKNSGSDLMEVDEAGSRIRRSPARPAPEYNEERKKALLRSTVYCKGFDKEKTTLDEMLDFFKPHGDVINVALRYYLDKRTNKRGFKGSLFLVFNTREGAEAFMAKDKIVYKEVEILRKWQEDYFEEKKQEVEESKRQRQERKDKVKAAREATNKVKDEEEEDSEEPGLPKGAVLCLSEINAETRREDIKEALKAKYDVENNEIAYVYFDKGDAEAKLRFREEDAAKMLSDKIAADEDEGLTVNGSRLTVGVLEGEEEKAFLSKCQEEMKKWKRDNRGGGRGRGHKRRGGFRGGRGGKRQRTE